MKSKILFLMRFNLRIHLLLSTFVFFKSPLRFELEKQIYLTLLILQLIYNSFLNFYRIIKFFELKYIFKILIKL